MNKLKINSIIDILAAVAFLGSSLSGLVLLIALPSGSGFRGGKGIIITESVFGLGRHEWASFHNISSIALLIFILIHLILHWQWIKKIPNYFKN